MGRVSPLWVQVSHHSTMSCYWQVLLLSPLFPANPIIMNVVSQFTVCDSVLGVQRHPNSGNALCPFGPASKPREGAVGVNGGGPGGWGSRQPGQKIQMLPPF